VSSFRKRQSCISSSFHSREDDPDPGERGGPIPAHTLAALSDVDPPREEDLLRQFGENIERDDASQC
jgi:hypothetical protein